VGTLYLVATPIGNLEDISARALRVLREVQVIAAEDTRQTRKLLSHYDIHAKLISYHEHSDSNKLESLLSMIDYGDIALVSDAGTPGINDPGFELIRAALDAGHQVSPVPGPSAPIAALVSSGLPANAFLYLGYLPRKPSERKNLLTSVAELPFTLIFLETPHRLLAALKDLQDILGDRQAAIAREMTKMYEEIFRGTLSEGLAHFNKQAPRGEFTLVIAGATTLSEAWSETQLLSVLNEYLAGGEMPSQIASRLSGESGWPRRDIYRLITQIQDKNIPG
jgi:16S rRNA (cytidine1402-2'-O)-methyltransferase